MGISTPLDAANATDIMEIHRAAYPIDTHLDSLYLARLAKLDFWKGDWTPQRRSLAISVIRKTAPTGRNHPHCDHVNGRDLIAGGYGGACFSAHALWENLVPPLFLDPFRNWVDHAAYVKQIVDTSDGKLRLAADPAAVRRARMDGAVSAILAVEGAHLLGGNGRRNEALRMKRLETIRNEGAAYLTLNHFCSTDISDAGLRPCNPWRKIKGGGLSPFGRQFLERCIDLGLLVDLSHTSNKGVIEAAEICAARGVPAMASHAASRTITNGGEQRPSAHLDRGFSDEAIRAIVASGGTISVILAPYYLRHSYHADGSPEMDADLPFVVQYYEKLAALIGTLGVTDDPWRHLSFGSDFDGGISSIPIGLESGSDLPKLTRAMVEAGWPSERICAVYSGNFLRVWEEARSKARF